MLPASFLSSSLLLISLLLLDRSRSAGIFFFLFFLFANMFEAHQIILNNQEKKNSRNKKRRKEKRNIEHRLCIQFSSEHSDEKYINVLFKLPEKSTLVYTRLTTRAQYDRYASGRILYVRYCLGQNYFLVFSYWRDKPVFRRYSRTFAQYYQNV